MLVSARDLIEDSTVKMGVISLIMVSVCLNSGNFKNVKLMEIFEPG